LESNAKGAEATGGVAKRGPHESDGTQIAGRKATTPSARPTRIRFVVLGVLFSLAVLTYLDRVCISVAAPWITRELGLSPVQMGLVFSVFAFGYTLFEVPTGWLGDRYGQRVTISRIVIWWSLFTFLTGRVNRLSTLLAVRFLFAAGEAGAYPNMTRVVANWFPVKRRGFAMGTIWMGSRLGAAVTPPLALILIRAAGWRETFYLLGAVGIVWAILWARWFRDHPDELRFVNEAELNLIREGGDSPPLGKEAGVPWRRLLTERSLWALYLMYFTLGFVYYLFITWFPTYLLEQRKVQLSALGLYASLPLLFSAFAAFSGGLLTDRLSRRWGPTWGRRTVGVVGCAGAAGFLVAGLNLEVTTTAVLAIALAAAFSDLTLAAAWATCADVGGRFSGTVSGTMNMIGNVGAMLSPLIMGYLVQSTGNWNLTFYIATCLALAGALLWLVVDPTKRVDRDL